MVNKSIFLCVNYPVCEPAIGISRKIKSQIETFQKLGFIVTYSAYMNEGIGILQNEHVIKRYPYRRESRERMVGLKRRFLLMKACADYLCKYSFDYGYIRWDAMDRSFFKVLRLLRSNCKTVIMDAHGYFKGVKGTGVKGTYIVLTTRWNERKIPGFVDLILSESTEKRVFGVPSMKIDTGIDVDQYKPHRYRGDTEELNLISVANETSYHGYDRIIRGIYNYKRKKGIHKITLHLVGKMREKTERLIEKLDLQKEIILHGYQTGKTLEELYRQCNLGVGPLAPHRVGGKQGTGIKTKEYFAIGLPYFYAGQELLVPDDYPYVYRIEADESPVDINELWMFYKNVSVMQNTQSDMREFARENFSWEKIYMKMLKILEERDKE